ncbi:hypothetical protein BURPS406E_C1628 [Burkholderia pseudomallei 406e]|nr:hypothetical protein BURPS406E_C1628 [Burkholderia pseudomallei 406e]
MDAIVRGARFLADHRDPAARRARPARRPRCIRAACDRPCRDR